MRILMLSQFYPPTAGGEERHVQDLSIALAARGHTVAVATLWQEGLSKYEKDRGVRIHRLSGTLQRAKWLYKEAERRHVPPFPDPGLTTALRRVVIQERPQVVHAHNWLLYSFVPLKEWSGAKFVVTLHDYSLVCVQKRLMNRGLPCTGPAFFKCSSCAIHHYGPLKGLATLAGNRAMAPFEKSAVDMFVTVSQATAMGNQLPQRGLPYQVIPNFFLEVRENNGSNAKVGMDQLPNEPYLMFVGDLVPDKGIDVLLQAYAGITHAPPLVLIGRDTDGASKQLPPNVRYLGTWPHDAVMQAWERSMFGILPSLVPETFGLVMLEAMQKGRPTIATNIGGLPDVILHGETGLLVPPGDIAALRTALECLISNPALRERMGEAAKRRAAEFSASRVVPRIEQLYQQLVSRSAEK